MSKQGHRMETRLIHAGEPRIGGAVTIKDQPRSAYDDAQIGLAGPIAGTFASLIVLQMYKWTNAPLYLAIAAAGSSMKLPASSS